MPPYLPRRHFTVRPVRRSRDNQQEVIADPHCHTLSSDGMVTPAQLVDAAVTARLDLIAVTDHDTMASVKETQERGSAAGLTVVAGQEITSRWPAQTHMLAWFLEKPIKRGMSLEDTVAAIHDQGALAIVPHPFMPVYFGSIQPDMLRRLLDKHQVDGIEMVFTVPIGASDCHFGSHDIASAVTRYQGDFQTAVRTRATDPERLRHAGRLPTATALRQQWRALVDLPFRRMRGQI